ncbi:hypothetical protein RI367_001816 [Sorochytrium milnesiophthora]
MPHGGGHHQHDHGCHDEAHDHDHDHSHDKEGPERGDESSLWRHIVLDNVRCLNESEEGAGTSVLKPWEERMDTAKVVESDADEQLILHVPFTGSVKLKSIAVRGGPGDAAPSKLKVFINSDQLDFDAAESTEPTQEFELVDPSAGGADAAGVIEYPTRVAKFNQVRSVSLYFCENFGADATRLLFVGFKGEWTELKRDPIITLYEAAANPADHATEAEALQKSSFAQ